MAKETIKKSKLDTKATSLNAAKRIFKGQEVKLMKEGGKKAHDGIVDAVLIAHYGAVYGHQ